MPDRGARNPSFAPSALVRRLHRLPKEGERCEAAPLAGENVTLAGGISARLCMPCRRAWNVHAWDAYEALCVEEAALVAEQRGISHDDSIRLETREQRVRAAALRVVDAKRDLRDMALDWLTPATD